MRQALFKDGIINLMNNIQLLLNASSVQVQVQVTQSCLTLCDPMDYTVRGILQARILEWVGSLPFFGTNQP